MDRLLDIVSEKLIVRFKLKGNEDTDHIEGIRSLSSGIGYRFISKEVKDLFKTLLEEHVVSKLEESDFEESVMYVFDRSCKEDLGTIIRHANDNMAEVLMKLPPLKEGEEYHLPNDTVFILEPYEESSDIYAVVLYFSEWIEKSYN